MNVTPRGRRSRAAWALLGVAVYVTSCGTAGPTGEDDATYDGDWILAEGIGPDGPVELDVGLEEPIAMTLRIDGRTWTGTAACNAYSGVAPVDEGTITADLEVVVTEMACDPPELMAVETAYLDALTAVDEVELTTAIEAADALTLTGPEAMLRFTRAPEGDPGSVAR
jgi:heat shock protein HslJ